MFKVCSYSNCSEPKSDLPTYIQQLYKPEKSCIYEPRLANYTHQCNITNRIGQITRDSYQHVWVGYENPSDELILHPHCPLDYCVNDTVVFPLNNTDT